MQQPSEQQSEQQSEQCGQQSEQQSKQCEQQSEQQSKQCEQQSKQSEQQSKQSEQPSKQCEQQNEQSNTNQPLRASMQPSLASTQLSLAISSATTFSNVDFQTKPEKEKTQIMDDVEKMFRKAYVDIVENPEWIREFVTVGKLLLEEQKKVLPTFPVTNTKFSIAYDKELYEFDTDKDNVIMIGRKIGCHINFQQSSMTSRVACLIFPFPEFQKIFVVDVGGNCGIVTEKRSNESSDKQCISSFPNARNVLIFDWNEIVVLQLGSKIVAINPKECVVCLSAPRQITFNCGHHVTCNKCAEQLPHCPVCRKDIFVAKREFGIKSFTS